uniref:Protein kinase domain-containing protein n=1 Tax=Kalanchoe fedtschenkoi TaxID=63787 RepID=A0A7N0TX06_KALFE
MRDLPKLLLVIFTITRAVIVRAASAYNPTDHILVDCGSSDTATATPPDNRPPWTADEHEHSNYLLRPGNSFPSTASDRNPSVSQVPYRTARVFTAPITYAFPLSAGPKLVRLFFYPATYSALDKTDSYFSLAADSHALLRNFSAYLTLSSLPNDPSVFFKEFYLSVPSSQSLSLTFTPNQNSHGFINGIEIISVPDALYRNDMVYFPASQNFIEPVKNDTAMEVAYRFNVGSQDVPVGDDTGMFRSWAEDNSYLRVTTGLHLQLDLNITYGAATPAYTAPAIVYTSLRKMGVDPRDNLKFNLTWVFPVHAGFMYIMRLHFCEIMKEVVKGNDRVFSIYIDRELAWESMDVFQEAGGRGIPIYRDFAVLIPVGDGKRGLVDLLLELHPYTKYLPEYYDAILNGLEIFKVNDAQGNLAGGNPAPLQPTSVPEPRPEPPGEREKGSFVKVVVGCLVGGLLGIFLLCFLIFRRQRRRRGKDGDSSSVKTSNSSWVPFTFSSTKDHDSKSAPRPLPSDTCRRFSFAEIRAATADFDSKSIIGAGGFGNVYRGYIDGGTVAVAIKRLNPSSKQGAHEFETEIEMLSKLRHLHLVPLIGYSDENGEMVLVYEYMSRGTLRDHLHSAAENAPLPWKKRLEICIGAARGLQYLHTGAKHSIIHRDVKSTNILLDENYIAKVSDFGLSRTGPTQTDQTHVTTMVKGSFGYVDPEYFKRQQLTEKSDVYSFGVVLLEVLCGRPALVTGLPKDRASLAEWGRQAHRRNMMEQIVDPNLSGQIAGECLSKFVEVAIGCLQEEGSGRPNMGDVVWALEFALQLQVSAESVAGGLESNAVIYSRKAEGTVTTTASTTTTNDDDDMFTQSSDTTVLSRQALSSRRASELGDEREEDRVRSGSVFSEIGDPLGR